jgi:hypothetical protein
MPFSINWDGLSLVTGAVHSHGRRKPWGYLITLICIGMISSCSLVFLTNGALTAAAYTGQLKIRL